MNNRQKLVQKQFLNNEEEIIGELEKTYNQALKDINDKISNLNFTINDLKLEYSWLDDNDPQKAKVKSMIQSKIYQRNYQEQLKKQVDDILKRMQTSQFASISEYLDTCYTDGFIGTVFDAYGQGVPFYTPINQEAMVRAVQLESKISKGLYTKLGEDVDLLKKRITAEVSRGIVTGKTYAQVAKQLENQTRIGFNKAVRIARTEGHRVQTTATMDAMESAKARGADVVKQWDATLDSKTRESHTHVDGEIRELDKPFSNGLMFPGDPSGGAAEVVNCRCALLQRARKVVESDDKSFTKFNGFTKQVEGFDSPEDYNEFKKAFMSGDNQKYMKYVEQMQDKYNTQNFMQVLDKMSEQEYRHYSKLLANNPIYRKKKDDEGVFTTFNNSKGDVIKPKSIMKEMNKSEIGKETLEYLNKENVPVRLYYGVDHPKNKFGFYDPIDDEIVIFGDVTRTTKETALTVIHETTHRKLGAKGGFDEEVECFKAEKLHEKGYLTNSDISDIMEKVKRLYPEYVQG